MEAKVIWLFVFVALYWAYCIFWGVKSAVKAKTASDYFIAGRSLSYWVFILAATATSISGWSFMDHPGLVYRDGFQFGYAAFYTIAIPFAGVLFLKRQWMLGKRFGYVTPGEMLADYFQGDAIRILTVLVALFFSIPFLGLQLEASGFLFNILTDGLAPQNLGMWVLSAVLLLYVALGGLRAVAYVDVLQCLLLGLGIVITGVIALNWVGGWDALNAGLAELAKATNAQGIHIGRYGSTPDGHSAYFAIPGVIQFTAGLGKEAPLGGLWTGVMCLTYMFALMGIQTAPAFTMWAFSSSDPKPFAPQQVWVFSFCIGLILFVFTAFQGMGAHLLGANPAVADAGLALNAVLPGEAIAAKPESLVAHYVNEVADTLPWLAGLLAVCGLAAMQSTGAATLSTAGGMLTRDLYKRYLNPEANPITQKRFGRLAVAFLVIAALLIATFSREALVLLGGLALAFGFQMLPSLAAVCWMPWITRQGATLGLAAGLIAVMATENVGLTIAGYVGYDLPWGRWPWTVHSAGWGILCNLAVCLLVSAVTQNRDARAHRGQYHDFLRQHAGLSPGKKGLVPVAWLLTLLWLFFGVGPGAVIGNTVFGAPADGVEGWTFGIPSIWAWQIIFWLLGVFMIWLLAYKMEMSTAPKSEIEALVDDIGDFAPEQELR